MRYRVERITYVEADKAVDAIAKTKGQPHVAVRAYPVEEETGPTRDQEWWTTGEVAIALGIKPGTVSMYRKRGQMPDSEMKVGRTHCWRPDTILRWHASRPRVGRS